MQPILFGCTYNDRGYERSSPLWRASDILACAQHGQAEVIAAFHRKYREGSLTPTAYQLAVTSSSLSDIHAGAFTWLPLSPTILDRTGSILRRCPEGISFEHPMLCILRLRAENGFRQFYSNDESLLALLPISELRGVNVID